jgi:enoyl-CoA hydratase/carnithine racemase
MEHLGQPLAAADAPIFLEDRGGFATLVLNRPDKKNALNLAMWAAIPVLLERALALPKIKALVVRGQGGVFSAGADIAEFEMAYATAEAAMANQICMQAAMTALEDFPLPTLAVIEGPCVGGGCGLALCCDLRFAAETARFGITPAKLGLVYGLGDTRRLVQAVGVSAAKDILFSGRLMPASEAKDLGLVNFVHAPTALDEAVQGYLAGLAGASTFTAMATKQILARLRAGDVRDDEASLALFASAFGAKDFQEGVGAFQQKRAPRFDR